jgi:hypothetical protein
MDWMWTWGGECFGYRDGHSSFTYFGREVGRFHNDEIYGSNGRYLGAVKEPQPTYHVPFQEQLGEVELCSKNGRLIRAICELCRLRDVRRV